MRLQGFQGNFSVWWCSLCFLISFGNWETKETLFCRPETPHPCYNIDISNVAKSCALTTKYTSVGCFHWKEGLPTERIYPWFLGEQNSHYFRQWHLTLCELSIAKNTWNARCNKRDKFLFLIYSIHHWSINFYLVSVRNNSSLLNKIMSFRSFNDKLLIEMSHTCKITTKNVQVFNSLKYLI